jgi:hypothetical protein
VIVAFPAGFAVQLYVRAEPGTFRLIDQDVIEPTSPPASSLMNNCQLPFRFPVKEERVVVEPAGSPTPPGVRSVGP